MKKDGKARSPDDGIQELIEPLFTRGLFVTGSLLKVIPISFKKAFIPLRRVVGGLAKPKIQILQEDMNLNHTQQVGCRKSF